MDVVVLLLNNFLSPLGPYFVDLPASGHSERVVQVRRHTKAGIIVGVMGFGLCLFLVNIEYENFLTKIGV